MTFEELQKQMSEAIKAGDNKLIEEIASQIVKSKADRHKAEADKLQKETQAMAGGREKLEGVIAKAVKKLGLDDQIRELKAKGFTYTVERREAMDADGLIASVTGKPATDQYVDIVNGGCNLIITTVKATKAGATGGNQKTKEEFGMSLDQVFEANKDLMTTEQAAEYDGATNSRKWQIKTAVKKVALKENRIAPVK